MDYMEIPILDAAARCGLTVDYNSHKTEVETDCPFCNDRKKHLSLNSVKNQFRCNRCGERGNSITLYAKLHNTDNKTAYKDLTRVMPVSIPVYEKKALPEPRQFEIKPLAERHDVYYDMLQMLELSADHKLQLMNRGLDCAAVERNMYRTVPEADSKLYSYVLYSLSKKYDLEGIPGFFRKSGKWHMVTKKGLFVPVCNHRGYIQGMQVRLDDVTNRKFRWFSSNHYDGGTRVIPWIHVAHWNNSKTAYLTEGALKSEVAAYLMGDVCIIGLAGVNCIEGLPGLLRELGITKVIEAMDMDKFSNPYVSEAIPILKSNVLKEGIEYRSATWNPAFKGIDDFYLALRKREAVAA